MLLVEVKADAFIFWKIKHPGDAPKLSERYNYFLRAIHRIIINP